MTPPVSAARALHDLFDQVEGRIGNPDNSAWHAWGALANAAVTTADFARFNAEVMALFQSVAEDVQSLTQSQQERYSVYLPLWWDALARPRYDWAEKGRSIIEQAPLHMLAGSPTCWRAGPSNSGSGARSPLRSWRGPSSTCRARSRD